MTHRFFVPPTWITPPTVTLNGDVARQIRTVLRMQPGDEVTVLDGSGQAWQVRLTAIDKRSVQGQIVAQQFPNQNEPRLHLTLYQGTLKAQKFEWVLQKGTELGVSQFAPTFCQRSIVRDPRAIAKKLRRWEQIIREAAEQSGRSKLPHLAPALPLAEAVAAAQAAHDLLLMPWEEATDRPLKAALAGATPSRIALFIGPEGGFDPAEAAQAREFGVQLVTLGPRILRAETAGLAACAAIFFALDEWE